MNKTYNNLRTSILALFFLLLVNVTLGQNMEWAWGFNSCEGTTLTENINGLNGSITGATWSDGYNGQSLSFDGVNDHVQITNSEDDLSFIQNTGKFTISLFIKLNDLEGRNVFLGSSGTSKYKGFALMYDTYANGYGDHQLKFISTIGENGVVNMALGAQRTINDNNWHHVAVVGDGSNVKFYVDGVQDGSSTALQHYASGTSEYPVTLGQFIDNYGNLALPYNGLLDELNIYNHPLSEAEISALAGLDSNPVSCNTLAQNMEWEWGFNSCEGTTLTENINGLDGSITGAAWSDGYNGQSLSFDGVNDHVQITNSEDDLSFIQNTGKFTISLFIKLNDLEGRNVFLGSSGTSKYKGFALMYDTYANGYGDHQLKFISTIGENGVVNMALGAQRTINDNNWHHVAVVGDGSNVKFYVDGVQDGSSTALQHYASGTSEYPVTLGQFIDNYGNLALPYNGSLDELKIFNRTLDATEISALAGQSYNPVSCKIGYPVQWTDLEGVQVNAEGNLVKAESDGWGNAGAASIQGLPEGSDGWVEFQVLAGTKGYMVGLSAENIDSHWMTQRYSIFIDNNGTFNVHEGGIGRANLGGYLIGDVFKIERVGTTIKYYRNNQVVYTSKVASEGQLLVDVALLNSGAVISNVITSFNAEYTPVAKAGYPVQWTDLEGVQVNAEGNLEKIEVDSWGNSGAASIQGLASGTDGWVEFKILDLTSTYMVGLSPENIDSDWSTQRYSIFIHANGDYRINEGGIGQANRGEYLIGDVFRIERTGNTITYLRNGKVVYTSHHPYGGQLLVDVSLHNSGADISEVRTSFNSTYVKKVKEGYEVQWTDLEGVQVNADGNLEKTEVNGWGNAGAASMQGLAEGTDGWVEFQTLDRTSTYRVGLSPENIDSDWLTQRYSIFIYSGIYHIFEGGIQRGNFGQYLIGDVFRIERSGNTIKYLHNGTVVYTSSVPSEGHLLVDVTLHNTGAVISDVRTSFNTDYVAKVRSGYPVDWVDIEGLVLNSDGNLEKNESQGWGNAGAASNQGLPKETDGWVEFQVLSRTIYMIGVSPENIDSHWLTHRYSIFIRNTGVYGIYEGGMARKNLGEYLVGDVFRIERTGNTIKYLRNGEVVYTSTLLSGDQLLVDIALGDTGTVVPDIRTSFNEVYTKAPKPGYQVQWTDVEGAVINSDGTLVKTEAEGWGNGGAASKYSLGAGEDGWVEFQVFNRSWNYMIGLSEVNLDADYRSLQYAIQIPDGSGTKNGYVRENGIAKFALSNYLTGETFRIERTGNTVKYLRNGSVVYISKISSEGMLLVDVSMASPGAELREVRSSFSYSEEIPDVYEIAALQELYESTGGPNWTNNTGWPTDWSTITSIDQVVGWHGVTVENGDVTVIALSSNQLAGPLPSSIGSLRALKTLSLANNQLINGIPAEIRNLRNLETLTLFSNPSIGGEIPPEIGSLTALKYLSLNNMGLTGTVPATMGNLTNLLSLRIDQNNLTAGLPVELANLTNLSKIYFGNNPDMDFGGSFPLAIRGMTKLTWLDANNTPINASLPEWIGELNKLSVVTLKSCSLTGAIPAGIGNLVLLKQLYLSGNNLTESIPESIGNLHNLIKLELNNNSLSGQVPASIGGCAALLNLDLSFNALSGSFPETINAHTSLIDIYLHSNNLTSFPAVSNVDVLYLKNNLLDFTSLEAQMINGVKKFRIYEYAPQNNNLTPLTQDYYVEQDYTIINDRSGGAHTVYQWETWNGNGWETMAGATSADLTLMNAGVDQNGKAYRCKMTNTLITDLTIYSTETVLNALVSLNYYTVADGNWNDPAIWSETSGGASANAVPTRHDKVIVEGHNVSVASEVECREVNINALQTGKIEVSGTGANLIVNGEIIIEGPAEKGKKMLIVNNGGKIECK